ncbi:hypothetical protein [Leptospira sp. GIMC2001]|uniref:hypothetical protein n=1 Tax=Leptospira sp. GIMC2001 TaxID=1513297 RepID=UPI00234A0E2D|nr:hypothetical protein [Leptospira sp. GIMC2001]WCL50210.1 hypothetical protein O4O04_05155 [Leptospira sp. GIMC2001]
MILSIFYKKFLIHSDFVRGLLYSVSIDEEQNMNNVKTNPESNTINQALLNKSIANKSISLNESSLNAKIDWLADMMADALMEESRKRVQFRLLNKNFSPEAA